MLALRNVVCSKTLIRVASRQDLKCLPVSPQLFHLGRPGNDHPNVLSRDIYWQDQVVVRSRLRCILACGPNGKLHDHNIDPGLLARWKNRKNGVRMLMDVLANFDRVDNDGAKKR